MLRDPPFCGRDRRGAPGGGHSSFNPPDPPCTRQCDGTVLDLSNTSLEGIAVLNIPSMYGGSNLWGETKKQRGYNRLGKKAPEKLPGTVVTDAKELKFCVQGECGASTGALGMSGAAALEELLSALCLLG